MTNEQLAAIRSRCDAATPGPWDYSGLMEVYGGQYEVIGRLDELADVRFVARARQDIPALLDALEEAEAKAARTCRAINKIIMSGENMRVFADVCSLCDKEMSGWHKYCSECGARIIKEELTENA